MKHICHFKNYESLNHRIKHICMRKKRKKQKRKAEKYLKT